MTIYNPQDLREIEKELAARKMRKVGTWMFIIVGFIVLSVFAGITMKKSFETLDELHQIEREMVEYANRDYFSNEYLVEERPDFMVELFPYGETDDQNYQAGGIRLIKITWYNSKRSKVESVDYKIVPFYN